MVKKGFSLPEVLIAIGIIGVLAIILIPQLTKDNPSRSKVIYRKAYNTVAQIVANMINDDVNYPATQFDSSTPPVPRGFNYTTATTNKDATNTYNKFCYFLANQLNTVGNISCPLAANPVAAGNIATTKIFDMPDGSTWYIRLGGNDSDGATGDDAQFPLPAATPPATYYATNLIVDIDGPYRGTNCSADGRFSSTYTYMPNAASLSPAPAPNPAYKNCTSATPATTPCSGNPDTFILGVRYDGKIYVGTEAGVDACGIDILKNPTTNTVK